MILWLNESATKTCPEALTATPTGVVELPLANLKRKLPDGSNTCTLSLNSSATMICPVSFTATPLMSRNCPSAEPDEPN